MEPKDMLIDFETIEKHLDHAHQKYRGIEAIPIDKIVGSLDRYHDFTEGFLPKQEKTSAKYESVKQAVVAGKNLPPIKVYQIFDSYFVIDGHHRVTVAKNEMSAAAIDAEVIEIHFDIELSPNKKYSVDTEQAKEFLVRLEEDAFEKKTFLKNSILVYPLKVTDLTSYGKLYEEILDFRKNYQFGEVSKKGIIYASYLWYETRLLPAVNIILQEKLLEHFPNRTYTDLYVWITQHKYFLSQKAGHDVGFDLSKKDFLQKYRKVKFLDLIPQIVQDIVGGIKREIRQKL
ncbi:MAG: hypothetical protein JW803_05825 [Endomicrobiales bacterium]|nr:hypothetical protein [Endomicrobiales bacterium]